MLKSRTFEEIKESGDLLFLGIRGSRLHGIATENSDTDTVGIFISRPEEILGTGVWYQEKVASPKNDDFWSELGKFGRELSRSNPNALETIFTPPEFILYCSPEFKVFLDNRDMFLTKKCAKSFISYGLAQIKKAKSLKKMISMDVKEVKTRKSALHFCVVPRKDGDGAYTLEKYLDDLGLKPEYCGAVHMPRGENLYNLYYDFYADPDMTFRRFTKIKYGVTGIRAWKYRREWGRKRNSGMILYRGVLDPGCPESTQIRLSSIPKAESIYPICSFQFNSSAFSVHCRDFHRYNDWVKNRNANRYNLNKDYDFDAKNMEECVRILTLGLEIAEGKGMRLNRENLDRDFLLSIKEHKKTYQEILEYVQELESKVEEAFKNSTLPEEPDLGKLESLIIGIRKKHYKNALS